MDLNTNGLLSGADVLRSQRTEAGRRYERFAAETRQLVRNDKDARKRLNDSILALREQRAISPGNVHSNTFLSSMSVQYANDEFIGDRLMPVVEVGKRSDSYPVYPKRERVGYPEDALGTRGSANELDESRSSDNYSVKDYGYRNFVGADVIENQDGAFDEMMDLVEAINEGIAFRREKRIATILTTGANFSGNTAALSGSDRWDSAASGDPIKNIQDGMAATWSGRGPGALWAYCSLDVANYLKRHSKVLDLFKYTQPGLVTMDLIARAVGLQGILVGAAREDTANSGQTASYSRIWGKVFGIVRVAARPNLRNASFGYTMRLRGDPVTQQWFDPNAGRAGGYYAKVATSEDHKIVAADTGYLFTTVIS